MEKKKGNSIGGSVLSSQNGLLLVSSGLLSLDPLLGDGIPVGTVVLIEEDLRGLHSKVLLKHFLAEGLVSKHSVFVASQDVNPSKLVKELPAVIENEAEPPPSVTETSKISDKLRIAFRYENVATKPIDETKNRVIGHHFDISKNISFSDIENADIFYWTGQRIETELNNNSFSNPSYHDLLKSIKNRIKDGQFFLKDDNNEQKTILRIGIHSLGSAMWLPPRKSVHSVDGNCQDLHMFIFYLRALVRSARAVAVITIPSYLYDEESIERCIHSSDIAMKLQSFSGTELEHNPSLQDFNGFFYLTKLAAINSLATKHAATVEYVFKLRRRKFHIEVLHLPPDIQDDDKKSNLTMCGGGGNNKLDF